MKVRFWGSIITLLLLSIGLTSCGSLHAFVKRSNQINEIIPQLELGITQEKVLQRIPYKPDFTSRQLLENQVTREVLTYRTVEERGWFEGDIYLFHHLLFDDGILVAVETEEDVAGTRRRSFISTHVGFVFF